MKWIISIIAVCLFCFLISFFRAVAKEKKNVKTQGGITNIYKDFFDGIMQYKTACISHEESLYVVISGMFVDSTNGRKCGTWSISLQQAFSIIEMRFYAKNDIGGVLPANKKWTFNLPADSQLMFLTVQLEIEKQKVLSHIIA